MKTLVTIEADYQFGIGGCRAPEFPISFFLPGHDILHPWGVSDQKGDERRNKFRPPVFIN
jgi:hypothetical protein